MADEELETANPVPAHREPPPSLGLVAHIWGGHLGSVDADADPVVRPDPSPSLDGDTIELPPRRTPRVKVD